MADDRSDRFALPLLHAGQAQKELFHNEALVLIDMLAHARAESADVSVPPASPAAGQGWIVPVGASGIWAGKSGCIAGWTAGGWRFIAPVEGMRASVADRGHGMVRASGAWVDETVRADGYYQAGKKIIGARAAAIASPAGGSVIDAEARATLAAVLTVLRGHGLIESG